MPATDLTLGVTLAVLAAGLLHAGWNALLKAAPGGDPLLGMAAVVAGSSLCGLVLIPLVGLPGGSASIAAYSIVVLWAMTRAPVAAVAVLRESSILFAALIGAVWLKEDFSLPRLAGAVGVVAGIATLKL